ncbi:GNAT family N-acetyltransferase [Winogradskyella alexanderae]|uniref:GNAT family N-acetyltransferase n=1 Tax=Winogradskyella alexanderae TaxID=2877123 RepID=A0ABS7XWI7_9FLAO|nr:GNAT family protein [Winogradskyella alexanderae]MCA0133196.1 GNAT family N-acetyltransferase [Winogradskyella alexanderae]
MSMPLLENERVKLSLLDLSNYLNLKNIAKEKKLIYYSPSDILTTEKLRSYVELAVNGYYHKTIIPFIIYDKKMKSYAGSTRFGNIDHKNRVLHIGWTWIGKKFQGTGLNTNMKFLMLQHAFETMGFEKVEFRIDERNSKSRRAVEKIGAKLEGTLRKNILMVDGYRRNTCCYGILKSEWPTIKKRLVQSL